MIHTPEFQYFRQPSEAEHRPHFSYASTITVENFVRIVGPVKFSPDDKVKCQIKQPDKPHRCGQDHFNGWIAVNKDGEEGYIGSTCGARDLKANEIFGLEKKRVDAEIAIYESIEILSRILADRPGYQRRTHALEQELNDLRYRVTGIRDALPAPTINFLRNITRTGGGNRVGVEYLTIRKDKDSTERTWTPNVVGTIQGYALLEPGNITTPLHQIEQIISSLDEVHINRCAGIKNLRRWAETLGQFPTTEKAVESVRSDFKNFMAPSNLKLLLLTIRNENVRTEIAELVLRKTGGDTTSQADCRRLVAEYDAELRSAQKNDGMRIMV